jgi:hypothetical protein
VRNVPPGQLWKFDSAEQHIAPNYVTVAIGSDALVAMDFQGLMNSGDSVASITSIAIADITGETEPTISDSEVDDDGHTVNIEIDFGAATDGTYTVSAKVLTTLQFVLVGKGRLVLA